MNDWSSWQVNRMGDYLELYLVVCGFATRPL
jgi:hypothetical protein